MTWHVQRPGRWAREQEIAWQFLDEVTAGIDELGHAYIVGVFRLLSGCGHEYDRFRVRIVYPLNFPELGGHPSVYLESHHDRWRNEGDSHIESSWRMCLYVPLESGIDFTKYDALRELFPCLHTFLFQARMYQQALQEEEANGVPAKWPGPERLHGTPGLLQAIRSRGQPSRNAACVCGSGRKYRLCCREKVRELERA